jgi:isoquinoline 1-oxidoreductase
VVRLSVVRLLTQKHLENQVEGAVVMAIGGALFEAIDFNNGTILNPRFFSVSCATI